MLTLTVTLLINILAFQSSTRNSRSSQYVFVNNEYVTCIQEANVSPISMLFHWNREVRILKPYNTDPRGRYYLELLIIISGLETNPGPRQVKYPCGSCNKACKWSQKALACDNCDQWFHASCMSINSSSYEALSNTSAPWFCTTCNSPNHSTNILYESTMSSSESEFSQANSTPNGTTHNTPDSSINSTDSIGSPTATSSPKGTKPKKQHSHK